GDEEVEGRGPPLEEGLEHELVRREGDGGGGGEGEEEGLPEAAAPCVHGDDARVTADGDELRVGEVRDPRDLVRDREAEGHHRVQAVEEEGVEEGGSEVDHGIEIGRGTGGRVESLFGGRSGAGTTCTARSAG